MDPLGNHSAVAVESSDTTHPLFVSLPGVNRTHAIPTPNIQSLADKGMKFHRSCSGPVCAPSRCTLITGRHMGHCTIRGNDGSYRPLQDGDATVASVLKQAGYTTGIAGKWGEFKVLC